MIVVSKTSLSVRCIVAVLLATAVSRGIAQVSVSADSAPKLDQLLTQAMDKNPAIIAAQAKLAMAEAELKNVRSEVARQLVACWNDIVDQEQAFVAAEEANSKLPGTVPKSALIDLKAKLARARSELQFLTGQAPFGLSAASTASSNSRASAVSKAPLQIPRGPMVEKVREVLSTPAQLEFIETPLSDVIDYLKDFHGIEIQIDTGALNDQGIGSDTPLTLNVKGISFGAAMQLLTDRQPDLKLVVRDYGILVTTPERADEAGYMPLAEFARLSDDGKSAAAVSEPKADTGAISPKKK